MGFIPIILHTNCSINKWILSPLFYIQIVSLIIRAIVTCQCILITSILAIICHLNPSEMIPRDTFHSFVHTIPVNKLCLQHNPVSYPPMAAKLSKQ